MTDRDDVIRYANRGMGEIAGIPTTAIVGVRVLHDFSEGTLRYFRPKYLEAKEALRPVRYDDVPVVTPAGRESLQSGWLIPRTSNGDFDGIICTVEDVTERKLVEEALRESEERHRAMFNEARDGVVLIDAETGLIRHSNPEFQRQTGRDPGQLKKMKIWELRPHEKMEAARVKFAEIRDRGMGDSAELEFCRPDGQIVPVEFRATVVTIRGREYVQSTTHDITERKVAEDALRESEERHRTLFEIMSQGVIYHDAEGAVISMNPAAERIMGPEARKWRASDPERRGWKLVREDGSAFARDEHPIRIALNEGKEARDVVMGMRGPDGNVRLWFRASIVPMFRPGEDKPFQIYTVSEDITEHKRAEGELAKHRDRLEELVEERTRELRDAQEELVRKERLAFLGELAGGVGHELRNPLGAIKNVAYYLKLVLKQPEPRVAESLDQMDRAVTKADRIISSLLDFAGQRPPTLLSGNVNDAVRGALSQVELPENVEVEIGRASCRERV